MNDGKIVKGDKNNKIPYSQLILYQKQEKFQILIMLDFNSTKLMKFLMILHLKMKPLIIQSTT